MIRLALLFIALPCLASVTVYNGTTNVVQLNFPNSAMLVIPSESTVTFEPTDEELQNPTVTVEELDPFGNLIDDEPNQPFTDGTALGYGPDGLLQDTPGTEKTMAEMDSDMAGYFTSGLETGSGLAAILLGFIAVRRALSIGDSWND